MDPWLLLRGLALGFSIAAPVGPIGLLCIRRTLTEGRVAGFVTGMGAATADMLYGCVAAFGLTAVTGALTGNAPWLRLAGGIFLLYMGAQTFRARPAARAAVARGKGLLGAYFSTLLLTITNPMTILSFAAMFAAIGAGATGGDYAAGALIAAGVFLGSALWWLLLSGTVGLLRRRMGDRWLPLINRASGVLIMLFGLLALASALAG